MERRWRGAGRPAPLPALRTSKAAVSTTLVLLAALYPGAASTAPHGRESVAVGDERDVWEPHIAAVPGRPTDVAVGVTQVGEGVDVALSRDGGRSWTGIDVGAAYDTTVAADRDGTFWVGHLRDGCPPVVTRIPAGSESPAETAVPSRPTPSASCDKPMIDIDIARGSPTYGRLRLTWLDLINARIVLTFCDTRPGGSYEPARCDDAANWSTTTYNLDVGTPQLWGPDVATGPDGTLYMVWNDRARGTIEGTTCAPKPSPTGCEPPTVIAITNHKLVCSIPSAQAPGRPISNSPTIDVDVSSGPNRGTVFVTWTDVGSGTPCQSIGTLPPPPVDENTQDINAFLAAAKGELPTADDAVRLYDDGEEDANGTPGAPKSDDFYPTVSADPDTGRTWVALYSSRLDETRKTNDVYVQLVRVTGEALTVSPLRKVSGVASGFEPGHQNNYGEYMGLDVSCDWPFPTWIRWDGDADALAYVPVHPRRACRSTVVSQDDQRTRR